MFRTTPRVTNWDGPHCGLPLEIFVKINIKGKHTPYLVTTGYVVWCRGEFTYLVGVGVRIVERGSVQNNCRTCVTAVTVGT